MIALFYIGGQSIQLDSLHKICLHLPCAVVHISVRVSVSLLCKLGPSYECAIEGLGGVLHVFMYRTRCCLSTALSLLLPNCRFSRGSFPNSSGLKDEFSIRVFKAHMLCCSITGTFPQGKVGREKNNNGCSLSFSFLFCLYVEFSAR